MSKRNERENRLSSSSSQEPPSPKRNRRSNSAAMEDKEQAEALSAEHFKQIMDKLSRLDNQMEEHFGNLTSEISILRCEMKQELEGVKMSLRAVEKSLESAWDSINDLQEDTKTLNDYKKTCQQNLDSHRQELDLVKVKLTKMDSHQAEIENLKTKLLEEQEKIIALENYSRRENLRFMNVAERSDEDCMDVVYDIIQNDLNINVEDIHFHAVHRVGKPRSEDASNTFPRPIIARFLSRYDRDTVFRARNRLKDSSRAKDIYITQDYARAIQQERKVLIKAMFLAKERGMSAKVVDRKLIVDNITYNVGNIPEDLRPHQTSAHA